MFLSHLQVYLAVQYRQIVRLHQSLPVPSHSVPVQTAVVVVAGSKLVEVEVHRLVGVELGQGTENSYTVEPKVQN